MPFSKFDCSICGAKCPREYLKHGMFAKRMAWLRRHRKRKHPRIFAKSQRKAAKSRKARRK